MQHLLQVRKHNARMQKMQLWSMLLKINDKISLNGQINHSDGIGCAASKFGLSARLDRNDAGKWMCSVASIRDNLAVNGGQAASKRCGKDGLSAAAVTSTVASERLLFGEGVTLARIA
jgi:hypothetical protein